MDGIPPLKLVLELLQNNKCIMYNKIAENIDLFVVNTPNTIVPTPTDDDYSIGFIRRYFVRKANDENRETAKDYVTLSFTSIGDGSTIAFKSYITSLSDSWSPTYTDIKYVGRQDTLKVFNGVTRNISLGFKIPSDSDASHRLMYSRLQSLIRASVVGDYVKGKPYIVGPMMKITVGNYVRDTPCVVTTLKIDTNPSEYPWEISPGRQLPQFLYVAMDFFILGDNNGNTIKKGGTFISIAS